MKICIVNNEKEMKEKINGERKRINTKTCCVSRELKM
jgi:hypothetical protein